MYVLKNGLARGALRNWKLMASNDGRKFDILSVHENDTSLNKKNRVSGGN